VEGKVTLSKPNFVQIGLTATIVGLVVVCFLVPWHHTTIKPEGGMAGAEADTYLYRDTVTWAEGQGPPNGEHELTGATSQIGLAIEALLLVIVVLCLAATILLLRRTRRRLALGLLLVICILVVVVPVLYLFGMEWAGDVDGYVYKTFWGEDVTLGGQERIWGPALGWYVSFGLVPLCWILLGFSFWSSRGKGQKETVG
jgi:hypothetical protein